MKTFLASVLFVASLAFGGYGLHVYGDYVKGTAERTRIATQAFHDVSQLEIDNLTIQNAELDIELAERTHRRVDRGPLMKAQGDLSAHRLSARLSADRLSMVAPEDVRTEYFCWAAGLLLFVGGCIVLALRPPPAQVLMSGDLSRL